MFPYSWRLSDGYPAEGVEPHGLKAFGTFVCGGGSTMGYKLAGFDHLGGVEIDERMGRLYKANHRPRHFYLEDIRAFNERDDLPKELYDLDLLDGSPPCSSFSFAGARGAQWGKKKKFAEGQKLQRLDDLVFSYVDTILKLRPKTFILENVVGLMRGNAKPYLRAIFDNLTAGGYSVQAFRLNGATMGLPQSRERVFVMGRKAASKLPNIKLSFNERLVPFSEISEDHVAPLTEKYLKYYNESREGKPVGKFGSVLRERWNRPAYTICASSNNFHPRQPRELSDGELIKAGSFPADYDFLGQSPLYIIGMSVPPIMTARIAHQIHLQWLKRWPSS